jgi:hypothetical protein
MVIGYIGIDVLYCPHDINNASIISQLEKLAEIEEVHRLSQNSPALLVKTQEMPDLDSIDLVREKIQKIDGIGYTHRY